MKVSENGTKVCPKCGRELSVEHFHKNKSNNDGLQIYCKDCTVEMNKKYQMKKKQEKEIVSIRKIAQLPPTMIPLVTEEKTIEKFTSRELLVELKKRGYVWSDMTITQNVDYAKI